MQTDILNSSVNNLVQALLSEKYVTPKFINRNGVEVAFEINKRQFTALYLEEFNRYKIRSHPFVTIDDFITFTSDVLPSGYYKKVKAALVNSYRNLQLMKDLYQKNNADTLEGSYFGHNVYPFPQLKKLNKADIIRYTNVTQDEMNVRLISGDNFLISCVDESMRWPFLGDNGQPLLPFHPINVRDRFLSRTLAATGNAINQDLILARPLISTRTVRSGDGYDIKLSLNKKITSERRNIFQANVSNAPIISDIVLRVLDFGSFRPITIQADIMSLRLADYRYARYFSAILRVSPSKDYISLIDFLSILPQKIKNESHDESMSYFSFYVVSMLQFVRLYDEYGIGLEPHLQILLIKNDGHAFKIRDLDNAYLDFKKLGRYVDLDQYVFHDLTSQAMLTSSEARGRLLSSLFHNNIAEFLFIYVDAGFKYEELMAVVRNRIAEVGILEADLALSKKLLSMYLHNTEKFIL